MNRHPRRHRQIVKKCSKSQHTALSELNITPLLDLAFVLLVIFVLTTTPITNDLALDLPKAANRSKEPATKVQFVTVDSRGALFLNRQPLTMGELQTEVNELRLGDTNLNFVIRGDAHAPYHMVREALETLQRCNVAKVRLATDAFAGK